MSSAIRSQQSLRGMTVVDGWRLAHALSATSGGKAHPRFEGDYGWTTVTARNKSALHNAAGM